MMRRVACATRMMAPQYTPSSSSFTLLWGQGSSAAAHQQLPLLTPAALNVTAADAVHVHQRRSILIINCFNGRAMQPDSNVLRQLQTIGIGADADTGYTLAVVDKSAFNIFIEEVRDMPEGERIERMKLFPKRLQRSIRYFASISVADPSASMQRSLQHMNAMLSQSKLTGVVGSSVSGEAEDTRSSTSEGETRDVDSEKVLKEAKLSASQVSLNEGQQAALDFALRGYNMYIGGSAGTGKTVLLEAIRDRLTADHKLSVAMTATTGVAGCHINGSTFHHAFHVGVGDRLTKQTPLKKYDVVIIDECSMMSAKLLQNFDEALRKVHQSTIPFAGTQIILTGDFLQLSAVNEVSCLETDLFRKFFVHMRLTQQVRQAKSTEFASVLEEVRIGHVPPKLLDLIPNSEVPQLHEDAVNLLPTNKMVKEVNAEKLARIDADEHRFPAMVHSPALMREWSRSFLLQTQKGERYIAEEEVSVFDEFGEESFVKTQVFKEPKRFNAFAVKERLVKFITVESAEENSLLGITADDIQLYQLYSDGYVLRVAMDPIAGLAAPPASPHPSTSGGDDRNEVNVVSMAPGAGEADSSRAVDHEDLTEEEQEVAAMKAKRRADRELLAAHYTENFNKMIDKLERFLRDKNTEAELAAIVSDTSADGQGLHTPQDEELLHRMVGDHPLIDSQELKVGARVLLRANITRKLVNGSIGTVVDFVPLSAEMRRPIACGRTNQDKVEQNCKDYVQFLQMETHQTTVQLPVVRFGDDKNSPTFTIPPWRFSVGGDAKTHYYGTSALCIPLSLAYAFTVHKVQGLTLVGRVHLELSKMWACEHLLYVAMSRVRTPDQLTMSCFRTPMILANRSAVAFSSLLPAAHKAVIPRTLLAATWRRMPHLKRRIAAKKATGKRESKVKAAMGGHLEDRLASSLRRRKSKDKAALPLRDESKRERKSPTLPSSATQPSTVTATVTTRDDDSADGDFDMNDEFGEEMMMQATTTMSSQQQQHGAQAVGGVADAQPKTPASTQPSAEKVPPKKKRGRPKKEKTSAASPPTPTTKRTPSKKKASPKKKVIITKVEEVVDDGMSPQAQRHQQVLAALSKAQAAQPMI